MSERTAKEVTAGYATFGFLGDENTGLHSTGADQCQIMTGGVAALTADSSQVINIPTTGKLQVAGVKLPESVVAELAMPGTTPATAANFGVAFFVADRAYQITSVKERHATAGNDAGAVTGMLKKVPSGTAASAGTDTLTAGLNLKAVADTNQAGTLHGTVGNLQLAAGDALAFVLTGTPTTLAGLGLAVGLKAI